MELHWPGQDSTFKLFKVKSKAENMGQKILGVLRS